MPVFDMQRLGVHLGVALALAIAASACALQEPVPVLELALPQVQALVRGALAPQRCPQDVWPVLSHDPQRSNATKACCGSPLSLEFRFEPPDLLHRPARVHHVVSDGRTLYASARIGESPAVLAVDFAGKLKWTFDSHVDITRHHWPAIVLDRIVLNDDGLYILERATGRREVDRGLDSWGEVLSDQRNLFANNTWHIAGPKLYVGALESGGAPLWTRNTLGVTREDYLDRAGGIALSASTLLQTLDTRPNEPSGIFAFRVDDGRQLWRADSIPVSRISVSGDRVYVVEREASRAAYHLVARSLAAGKVLFRIPVDQAEADAPTLAGRRVLLRTRTGTLLAFDRETGREVWRRPSKQLGWTELARSTSFAVALGNRSVVVSDGRELALLDLATGRETWRGRPTGAKGILHSPIIAAGRVVVVDAKGFLVLSCGR